MTAGVSPTGVATLAPAIAARAAEIEAGRRVPADLLADLVAAGCFRLLLPPSHGGLGADLPSALGEYEALARADASVGWIVLIGGGAWCDLASLPRATFDALYAAGPDVIVAGTFAPSGSIAPDGEGGYRVSGRWALASGCEHATWLYGNAVESVVDGHPQLRAALLAPSDVVIEDTWDASGLRGSGSHHFHVDDLAVPADRTFVPLVDEPCLDTPVVRIPLPSLYGLGVASIATGIALGALDDVFALAAAKVPMLAASPLATNPVFQHDIAAADTQLRAARALLREAAEEAWGAAVEGAPFTPRQRADLRAAAAWVTARAAEVVDEAYRSGGSSSVYAGNPLQRRFRDVHAVTQHFLVKDDTLTTAGAVLVGQEIAVPVF